MQAELKPFSEAALRDGLNRRIAHMQKVDLACRPDEEILQWDGEFRRDPKRRPALRPVRRITLMHE